MTSMDLQFHNTLTRKKERFEPLDPKNVRMYVCGPTVYDLAHIGNARPAVVFDVLFRLLRHVYGADHVTYARNITDVDDKIMQASKETGEAIESITQRTTQAYHDDMHALGVLRPSIEPRATQHIGQMIAMMEALIEKGHAYAAEGHVLFSVPSMDDYGELSRLDRDALIAGARVDVAPYKKDPADFVLWKPSAADQPGWDSPWGPDARAGTSNARPCRRSTWARPSTSTAAAWTWSSRTTKTRSPRAAAPTAPRSWPGCGCTTATWW